MLSEWELWAIAQRLIDELGDDAFLDAAKRAKVMVDKPDLAGAATWVAVAERIKQLQAKPQGIGN